jgi:type I restriction enzyme S subunit
MKELRIKDICDKGSSNLKQKDVEGKKGKYPVYGASGVISHIDSYHQEENYIAIVKDGSGIGRVTFMPAKSSVIGTMQYILPKEGFNINYIGYCLQSLDLSKYKQGAAIPHIYFRDYGERIVNVTEDIKEQQSIVEYLDSAFAKIDAMKANAEKALNEAKALFQASLKEMLEPKDGWVTSTLKDECFKITDGTHQTPKYFQSGYIFLSSKNVTSRKIDWDDVKFIDENQHLLMHKRVAPQVGDILLAKNGTTGVAAMVDRDVIFDIYVSLALLRSKGNVTPEYLLTYVNSPIAKEQFDKRLIGMGVPNLHLGEINQVVITYPKDKTEQAKMTQRIEDLDNVINRLQENFDKISQECDALKQAILKQVFE